MSARTGFIAAFTAAVAASVAIMASNKDTDTEQAGGGHNAASPEGLPSEPLEDGLASSGAAEVESPGPEVLSLGEPEGTEGAAREASQLLESATSLAPQPNPSGDAGLGASPQGTAPERYAQELVANLGWDPLGPYEATVLGQSVAQFVRAREIRSADPQASTEVANREAQDLGRELMEQLGSAKASQLIELLGVEWVDPQTGTATPLDLGNLGRGERER